MEVLKNFPLVSQRMRFDVGKLLNSTSVTVALNSRSERNREWPRGEGSERAKSEGKKKNGWEEMRRAIEK